MTFKYTLTNAPWVSITKDDPRFTLHSSVYQADRAAIQFERSCPQNVLETVAWAIRKGHIKIIANVPKTDPTLIWETLKQ